MIYHLTTDPSCLEPESLRTEGFVHCSTATQLLATAERYFAHLDEVQVLVIDPARLTSELRYELPTGADSPDELFPHLYGPIEALAVLGTTRLQRAGGRFTWADEAFPEGEVPSRQEKAAT